MKRWMNRFSLLAKSEQGSALPMIGLGIMALLGSAGVAIDMSRAQLVQARMANSLDSAGLAAGAVISTADATSEVNKYFYANFPVNYMGTTVQNLTVTSNADGSQLTLDVSGTVPTTFMRLFGQMTVPVSAHTEITRASKGMELVMVMDVTGSMTGYAGGGQDKLEAAQDAAHSLLDIVYGSNTEIENLWVGLIPFSQAVNIGTSRDAWTESTSFNWGPTSWYGCVEARAAGGNDVTDVVPSIAPFPKYYSPCNPDTGYNDSDTNAWYGTNSSSSGGNPQWGNCQTGWNLHYRTPLTTTTRGPNLYCPQPLTPMTKYKETVEDAIDAMTAQGGTEIVLGLAWAHRMLSPNWRGLWGGEMDTDQLPQDYNTPLMNKVVILMTDGDNDIAWDYYSAYGTPPSTTQLGPNECLSSNPSNCTNGEDELDDRMIQVCDTLKSHDVLVYTIAFGTSISSSSQDLLEDCATNADYYFYSPSGADLQTAFQTIGDSLANLRISK